MLFRRLIEDPDAHVALPTPGTDLFPNPGLAPHPHMKAVPNPWLDHTGRRIRAKFYDRGWNFDLTGAADDDDGEEVSAASILVGAVPPGRPLEICFKATSVGAKGTLLVLVFGFDEHGNRVFSTSFSHLLENDFPMSMRRPLHPSRDVRTLKVFFQRVTPVTVHMNKVRLIVGVPPVLPRTMDLVGAGLIYATAQTHVLPQQASTRGTLSFPIPIQHGNQVPVAFELSAEPQNALRGFRWEMAHGQNNIICHAALESPDTGVELRWESLVFVDEPNQQQQQLGGAQSPPALSHKEFWQTGMRPDPSGLRIVSERIHRQATDVVDFARQVENVAKTQSAWARVAAAMFHAQNIPARVGIVVPTDGDPNPPSHNFLEWHHPELGWTRISNARKQGPCNSEHVVLRIAAPDEMESINTLTLDSRSPRLRELDYAQHFLLDNLAPIPKSHGGGGHISMHAHPVMQLHHQRGQLDALRQACKRAWTRQLEDGRFGLSGSQRNAALLEAVRDQDSRGLLAALNRYAS